MIPADIDIERRVLGAAMANTADGAALVPMFRESSFWWWPGHAKLAGWLEACYHAHGTVPYASLRLDLFAVDLEGRWRWTIAGAPDALADDIDKCRSVASPCLYRDAMRVIDLAERRRIMRATADAYQAAADSDIALDVALGHLLDDLGVAA